MRDDALSSALSNVLTRHLLTDLPGRTLRRVIKMTLNKERYAGDLGPVVLENPLYTRLIIKVDFLQARVKEWISEMPEGQVNERVLLERIFILLGKQASRNLVASIRLARLAGVLPRKKSERFTADPKELLKHALVCEEFCESRGYASSELAFLAGLQYDFLLSNFRKFKLPKSALEGFQSVFPESLRRANLAYEIASRMGSFPYIEHAFPAALSLGLGQVLAGAIYPKEGEGASYVAFLAEIEKRNVMKWDFAELEEKNRFPLSIPELAALAAHNYGFFKGIEASIRFSRESYFLKKTQPRLYPLAVLLGLAERAAANRPLRSEDVEGLKSLGGDPAIIQKALNAVSSQGKA